MKTSAQVLTDKDQTINELDFQKTVLENELKILAAKIREIQKALDLKETFALNLKLQLDKS
jgi:peptidoglycan hydrolase CwlO-like protein